MTLGGDALHSYKLPSAFHLTSEIVIPDTLNSEVYNKNKLIINKHIAFNPAHSLIIVTGIFVESFIL